MKPALSHTNDLSESYDLKLIFPLLRQKIPVKKLLLFLINNIYSWDAGKRPLIFYCVPMPDFPRNKQYLLMKATFTIHRVSTTPMNTPESEMTLLKTKICFLYRIFR